MKLSMQTEENSAIRTMQAICRGAHARKSVQDKIENQENDAVRMMQAICRGAHVRREAENKFNAMEVMSAMIKGATARREMRLADEDKISQALQQVLQLFHATKELSVCGFQANAMQAGRLLYNANQEQLKEQNHAASRVQAALRGFMTRRQTQPKLKAIALQVNQ